MKQKRDCIKVSTTPEHHAAMAAAAKQENISLNQYCLYILALTVAGDVADDGFDDLFKIDESGEVCQ